MDAAKPGNWAARLCRRVSPTSDCTTKTKIGSSDMPKNHHLVRKDEASSLWQLMQDNDLRQSDFTYSGHLRDSVAEKLDIPRASQSFAPDARPALKESNVNRPTLLDVCLESPPPYKLQKSPRPSPVQDLESKANQKPKENQEPARHPSSRLSASIPSSSAFVRVEKAPCERPTCDRCRVLERQVNELCEELRKERTRREAAERHALRMEVISAGLAANKR